MIIIIKHKRLLLRNLVGSELCVDSSQGTNHFNFNLTTIIVIDEFGEGYPACFLYKFKSWWSAYDCFKRNCCDSVILGMGAANVVGGKETTVGLYLL